MKNFIYALIALILGGIIVFSVFKDMQNSDSASSSQVNEQSSIEEECSTNESSSELEDSSSVNTGEGDNRLTAPANVSSYIADGLQMQNGAQLNLSKARPALKYSMNISEQLKTDINSNANKKLAFLLMPTSFFDYLNPDNYTYIDWLSKIEATGASSYMLMDCKEYGSEANAIFENIAYKDVNRMFTVIGVLITTNADGSKSYQYASFPNGENYRTNARSVAYLAAESLNAHKLGMENFTPDEIKKLKSYINESVDKAYEKSEATDDGSTFVFSVKPSAQQSLSVGQTFKVDVEISPGVEIPIWYRSTDESILEVDENGYVTAKAKGMAIVGVYVAGETYGITVKVS